MIKKNKKIIYLFILGSISIINGAYLKLNGNPNADIMLACGIIMKSVSFIGFIMLNLKKIKMLLSDI